MAEHSDIMFIITTVSVPTTEMRVTMNGSEAYLRFRAAVSPALPYPTLRLPTLRGLPRAGSGSCDGGTLQDPEASCSSPIARCSGSRMIISYRVNQQPCSSDADDNLASRPARTKEDGTQRNAAECESPQGGCAVNAVNRHLQGKKHFLEIFHIFICKFI